MALKEAHTLRGVRARRTQASFLKPSSRLGAEKIYTPARVAAVM